MADQDRRTARHRAAGRWGRASAVVLGTGLAVSLAACVQTGQTDFTPQPVETISASPQAPATSASPTKSASSASSSAPAETAGVKATGTMAVYAEVSKALKGTCRTGDAGPAITLSDHANGYYKQVDVAVALDQAKQGVVDVSVTFAEDSEGFAWQLDYSSTETVKGTSAKLSVSGNTYTISGKLQATETRKAKTITEVVPFTIVAKCAGADW